jgi:hypothetical protein
MKFYIDIATRRFVRGPASSIPLERLFLKRRDKVDVEIVFVEKSAIVATPTGTSFSTGLKTAFSDTAFLALSDLTGLLDLYTTDLEALFADDPASVSAFLEVKTSRPGEETRTSTLCVDIENSVILGDEGLPSSVPSLKATAAEATAGTSNETWMTPLRTAQAIAALGSASVTWASLPGKPSEFPPASHTHTTSQILGLQAALDGKQDSGSYAAATHTHTAAEVSDFAAAVSAVSPPAAWGTLTGKPATFPPDSHTHATSEITGLDSALATKQPLGNYATAAQGAKADTASQPGHTHAISEITGLADALAAKMSAFIAKSAVSGGTIYTGRAAPATAESASGWTIRRTVTNSAGSVTSSGTASGAWDQRASLVYA